MDDLACFRRQLNSSECHIATEEIVNKFTESKPEDFEIGDYFVCYLKHNPEVDGIIVISLRFTTLRKAIEETKYKKFISYSGIIPEFQF